MQEDNNEMVAIREQHNKDIETGNLQEIDQYYSALVHLIFLLHSHTI